jgi:hypothetical protein
MDAYHKFLKLRRARKIRQGSLRSFNIEKRKITIKVTYVTSVQSDDIDYQYKITGIIFSTSRKTEI